jgi:hypothetical protein
MATLHHSQTAPNPYALRPGAEVMTDDNRCLGTIKEIDGRHFKVDVRWHRDYWLDGALVRRRSHGRVVLNVGRKALPGYKLRKTERGYEPMVRLESERAWDQYRLDS